MPQFQNIHVIINPASGQPQPVLHTLNSVLYPHDVAWDIAITQEDGSGQQQARAAIEAGADLIVVYGGDGTVGDVVNGILGHDIPLAILHGGTGNALAHELGIPGDLTQAAQLIVGEHSLRRVDVGQVTPDDDEDAPGHFVLRMSVGLQTDMLAAATRDLKTRFGNLAYVIASLRSLADSRAMPFELSIDGENHAVEGLLCMVTNSASVGGPATFRFAPDIDPDDGVLDVFVFDTNFESVVTRLIEGKHAPFAHHWQCRDTLTLHTPDPLPVTLDGEPFAQTPVTVAVRPQAINVLVPAAPSGAQ